MVAPKTEVGSVDALPSWGYLTTPVTADVTEPVAWVGAQRVQTVNRMRTDAQVDSLCNSVTMPVLRMSWTLNPNGARDEVVQQISTDLGVPIKGSNDPASRSRRRFKHRDHLEHALLALWYGHMFFEQVPDTENFDLARDGWRLRKLAPRMPHSIDRIHTAHDGGLAGITQIGYASPLLPKRRGLSLVGTNEPQIPVTSLAAYVWKREGSNWAGRSMLRPLYRDWVLKDRALRVDSMKNERFGIGIPTATAPVGGDPTQYAALAQAMRASEFGGVGLESGASVGIEGIRGTLPDVMASIRYYDESMARSFMAMVVQLGQTQTGSRALGETFADFFQMLVEAVANWYRDTTNEHVIEDLVDWNWGEDEQAPTLEWSYPQGEQTLAIAELVSMVQAGVIVMDPETERAVRQRTRLPQLPEAEEEEEEVRSAASSPFSSVGLPALVQAEIISPEEARDLLGMTGPAPTPKQVAEFLEARRPNMGKAQVAVPFAARKQTLEDSVVGHRNPTKIEAAAGTDFEVLQKQWTDATADLVADWKAQVQAAQIDELVEATRKAVDAGDLVALSRLQASAAGVDLLTERFTEMAEDAIVGARAEALAQGVKIGTINTAKLEPLLQARAEATANLLSRGISDSASRVASNMGVYGLSTTEMADVVRSHLEGLSDAYLQDMLGGSMTQAQNTGRKAVFEERPSRIYASELLDQNTCERCAAVDGKEYGSLAEAEKDYPTGGNKDCLGGPRCRGTLVAVYEEGDAATPPPAPPAPVAEPEPDVSDMTSDELYKKHFAGEVGDAQDYVNETLAGTKAYTQGDFAGDDQFKQVTVQPDEFGEFYASQASVDPSAVQELMDLEDLSDLDEDFPVVYAIIDDKKVLIDGHHRALAAAENGESLRMWEYQERFDLDDFPDAITINKYKKTDTPAVLDVTPPKSKTKPNPQIASYVDPGRNQKIQQALRSGEPLSVNDQFDIDKIDAYLAKGSVAEDGVLYRGVVFPDPPKVGSVMTDHGYTSVSTSEKIADDFARLRSGEDVAGYVTEGVQTFEGTPYIMTIRVRAGQIVNSGDPFVQEMVLPRGTSFRVVSVDGNRITVEVT